MEAQGWRSYQKAKGKSMRDEEQTQVIEWRNRRETDTRDIIVDRPVAVAILLVSCKHAAAASCSYDHLAHPRFGKTAFRCGAVRMLSHPSSYHETERHLLDSPTHGGARAMDIHRNTIKCSGLHVIGEGGPESLMITANGQLYTLPPRHTDCSSAT